MRAAIFGAESMSRLSEPQGRMILVPFDKRECLTLKQAADVAGKSESTMRGWAERVPFSQSRRLRLIRTGVSSSGGFESLNRQPKRRT